MNFEKTASNQSPNTRPSERADEITTHYERHGHPSIQVGNELLAGESQPSMVSCLLLQNYRSQLLLLLFGSHFSLFTPYSFIFIIQRELQQEYQVIQYNKHDETTSQQ